MLLAAASAAPGHAGACQRKLCSVVRRLESGMKTRHEATDLSLLEKRTLMETWGWFYGVMTSELWLADSKYTLNALLFIETLFIYHFNNNLNKRF